MLASLSTLSAQHAFVSGKFHKLLPNMQPSDRVFISKPENGDLKVLAEPLIDKDSKVFKAELAPEDQNEIRYVGIFEEQYPVYMRKGEELTIDAAEGHVLYSGKLSKENKVFADWYKLIAPIRDYGYSKGGYRLPQARFAALIDSLALPIEDFVKNIRTGNVAFDKQVKYLLPYSYKFDLLMPFASGFGFASKAAFPPYFHNWFKNETFSDAQLWTLPFGYNYMQYFGFAKHIIYNNEQGMAGELLVSEIADKELKANYILSSAEKGVVQDLVSFLENNRSSMLTEQHKAKMAMLESRAKARVAGGDWIDFAYPDIDGKVRKLSDNLGKVVLIDVWATWCKPCLAELPALEKLEKDFEGKDVVFISLSIDTDKAKWQEMVKSKNLSGVQLFSNNQGPIVQDYQLIGIPRFILFDKNGKTVEFDAPRPSDPKLKELITSKL